METTIVKARPGRPPKVETARRKAVAQQRASGNVAAYCTCCPDDPKKLAVIEVEEAGAMLEIHVWRNGKKHFARLALDELPLWGLQST